MEDLTPLYNKEFYLAYLCGEDVVLPIPDGNAERYLAYLCGMDVTIPDVPDGRTETYLAYKCGEDVVLPDPMYRIEYYLAKWCGIDCEVPEPMYRIEYWLAQLANSGELKTVTGNPITVSDALAKPAESLTIEILPQQDLHGYDNPWPAGGGKQIYNSSTFGTVTLGKITCTNNGDGSFTLNADEADTADRYFDIFKYQFDENVGGTPLPSAQYRLTGTPSGGSATTYTMYVRPSYSNDMGTGVTFTNSVIGGSILIKAGYRPQNLVFRPMLRLASVGDDTFAPYSNLCPITGFTGVNIYRESAYDPDADPTYSISWQDSAGTVYGGTLDVVSGVMTKAPYYDSYNGEPLVGPWVSSMDKYVPGATPTTGAQVVDLGGTGTDVQLSATEVQMLLGNNVIWNDVGDMVLEYLADGPADDIDALQILLNNRYVNNGEPDEATDKEALEILLGGNTR